MSDSTSKFPDFQPNAMERWKKVPNWAQTKILNNVWCGNCQQGVPINLLQGRMEDGFLILRGKCKYCSKEIARLIEPEE